MPADQWALEHLGELSDAAAAGGAFMHSEQTAAAPALADHMGLSALLLSFAAILFAQLFVRRGLALTGMAAAMILCLAAMDRVALSANLSHMEDANAPAAARVIGLHQSSRTFFYARTATEHIASLAQQESAPSGLRELAKRAAASLAWANRPTDTAGYPNRRQGFKNVEICTVYSKVGSVPGNLIYGFAFLNGMIKMTSTTNPQEQPSPTGIFWHANAKDGLWVNGDKVSIPSGCLFVAIRSDGTIVPFEVSGADQAHLAAEHGAITGMPEFERRLEGVLRSPKNE
jgi:hypothetical protein